LAESYSRPNPDALLAQIKAEEEQKKADEEQKKRGRLKIFLGYAAGVGKTYTMLEAARQRKKELDVVVAYVETHGRAETEALLEGLEIIPRKKVEYRGVMLHEMDLDGVLARRPQLALVDELAHTNAPDSRHPKRYQDVEELLDAGIDVYTTLNVQHIESVRDVVAQITGVWVRETVPDSVIDKAAEIELVDLPPDELLKRLKEGKVYIPQQIAHATAEFFRKGNLTALRELSMRTAAERAYLDTHAIRGPGPTGERLLVCISSASRDSLVRDARRLASQLGAEFFAIYVETPDDVRLWPDQLNGLTSTLRLAERLGAKVTTLRLPAPPKDLSVAEEAEKLGARVVTPQETSVATAIVEYARTHNITKIVVGKPRRTGWQRPLRRSVVGQIIRQSEANVYIVTGKGEPPKRDKVLPRQTLGTWRGYLQGLALVTLATLFSELIHRLVGPDNIVMIYVLCVVITAIFWGLGPSVLVSVLSVLAFDFFLLPPFHTFAVADAWDILTLLVLLVVGVTISYLMTRFRQQTQAARRREFETATLYALSRNLTATFDAEAIIRSIINGAKEMFGRDVVIFLPDTQNKETLKPHVENPNLTVDDKDIAAAFWSFQHQKIIGYGTDTLPNAKARYLPLNTTRGVLGVMALWASDSVNKLTAEQSRLLEAYADLAALAIERIGLAEQARNAEILEVKEGLQAALLNSISHDLRTPLASIIGVLSSLQEEGMGLDDRAKKNLIQVAREEAERLNHLITNLLDMSRIEAGGLRISKQPSDVQDIIGVALEQLGGRYITRPIKMNVPAELPFVSVDFGLIVQVLVNILDNALKYSPPDSPIEINGRQVAQQIEIAIADHGIGIPPEDLLRVFDKFYRVQRPHNVPGTGLGLSICKGIVEAHGGRIWAENNPGGGTIIKLALPIEDASSKDER
jgi:two-component system sensor histidine kinase KdpD